MGLILDAKELTPLTPSVSVGIVPFNPEDKTHWHALKETIYGEALVHGEALFNDQGFEKVIEAAGLKKIHAEFIVAAIENCAPRVAGGAIRIPSALLAANDSNHCDIDVFCAEHAEDTSFSRGTSKIIRELTANDDNPKGIGIGSWYMQERFKRAADAGLAGFTSEFSEHNLPIIKTYQKFPTILGHAHDSAVFQITGLTPAMHSRLRIPVETENLAAANSLHLRPHIFVTSWSSDSGKQKITALFTESLSTYTGDPVVRVQMVSNGHLPHHEALKDILVALIRAGQNEIQERGWAPGNVYSIFGGSIPTMCIHVLKDQNIVRALQDMDVPSRILGGHHMCPAFMRVPKRAAPVRPFVRVSQPELASKVYVAMAS